MPKATQSPPVNCKAIKIFGGKLIIEEACPALISCETLKSVHGTATLSGQPSDPHWLPTQQTDPAPTRPPLLIVV